MECTYIINDIKRNRNYVQLIYQAENRKQISNTYKFHIPIT